MARFTPQRTHNDAGELLTSQFIPYTAHYDPHTLITRDGDLIQFIRLDGFPAETVDADTLNHKKNALNNMFMYLASLHIGIYIHVLRRKVFRYPVGDFSPGFAKELDKAWRRRMKQKPAFLNDMYLSLCLRRTAHPLLNKITKMLSAFSRDADRTLRNREHDAMRECLDDASTYVLAALSHYNPRRLGVVERQGHLLSQPLAFLSGIVNLEVRPFQLPAGDIAAYLSLSRLHLRGNTLWVRGPNLERVAAVLGVKQFKTAAFRVGQFDGLLNLPHEFVLTYSFLPKDIVGSKGEVHLKENQLESTEDDAISQMDQLGAALDDLTSGQIILGAAHISIMVYAADRVQLSEAVSALNAKTAVEGVPLYREDFNLEAAYWAQLPGNFSWIARRPDLSSFNLACLAPFHNYPAGSIAHNQWGAAVTVLETESRTHYAFNWHDRHSGVGNATIVGQTGSGKTALLMFLLSQTMRLNLTRLFLFDKRRGCEIFVRAMGGQYTVVSTERASGFNPLQLDDTEENRQFLMLWLRALACHDNSPLACAEDRCIENAVVQILSMDPSLRTLSSMDIYFKQQPALRERLSLWYGGRRFSTLFDNPHDSVQFASINGFDMTDLLDNHPAALGPVALYLAHLIKLSLDGARMCISFDEGWSYYRNPVFRAYSDDWSNTIRRSNGILIYTSTSASYIVDSGGSNLIEQSATNIYFGNKNASYEHYVTRFGLNVEEYNIVRTLDPQGRAFLLKHGNDSVIATLDLAGMENLLSVLSTRTANLPVMEQAIAAVGNDAMRWLPIFWQRRVT